MKWTSKYARKSSAATCKYCGTTGLAWTVNAKMRPYLAVVTGERDGMLIVDASKPHRCALIHAGQYLERSGR